MDKPFDCYSHRLMKFLLSKKLVPYKIDKHYKTKKTFWRYEMSQELSDCLHEWSNNKTKN